jgi:hypothetical protein
MKLALALIGTLVATGSQAASAPHQQQTQPTFASQPFSSAPEAPTATTGATEHQYKFTIAAGSNSKLVSIPENRPVHLMIAGTTLGWRGVGEATVLSPTGGAFVEWVGIDYFGNAISEGWTNTSGTHMVWADYTGQVDVQVASGHQIMVHNAAAFTETVVLSLIY